jgi:hypothetical protein
MARARFSPARWCFALVVLALCAGGPAAAQNNTIPQTTCGGVSGTASCLTNGFLQSLTVNCAAGERISNALASLTDRNGPNLITISGGICNAEVVNVVGFNRLTIQGPGSIDRATNIVNSRQVTLRKLLFNFATAPGDNITLSGAAVTLDNVTVENTSFTAGINVFQQSSLGFAGASAITGNGAYGIDVSGGSLATVANVTISNNGHGTGVGGQKDGIRAHNGGSVILANVVRDATGNLVDGPVDISLNGGDGIKVDGGHLSSNAEGGSANALVHIHDNTGVGVEIGDGAVELDGHFKFDNNDAAGSPFSANPVQIVAGEGSTLGIGEGAVVEGGLAGAFHSFVIVGDGGGMTLTGGLYLAFGAVGLVTDGNTIDTILCDDTSWIPFLGASTITSNNCPTAGPRGTTGPAGSPGPAGPQGIQGPPGTNGISAREEVSNSVTLTIPKGGTAGAVATCPAGKTVLGGGATVANTNLAIWSIMPFTTQVQVAVQNISAKSQTGTILAKAICASVQ